MNKLLLFLLIPFVSFGQATLGCMDENACNYDPAVTVDDGSCTYPDTPFYYTNALGQQYYNIYGYDCDGNCLLPEYMCSCQDIYSVTMFLIEGCFWPEPEPENWIYPGGEFCDFNPIDCEIICSSSCGCLDEDGDGWCDDINLLGCTDWPACNFNPNAIQNDGSCEYDSCFNCDELEVSVEWYYENCNADYGLIISDVTGGTPPYTYAWDGVDFGGNSNVTESFFSVGMYGFNNFNVTVIDANGCSAESGISDGFLIDFWENLYCGCTDENACNYDPNAVEEDGSCIFPSTSCWWLLMPEPCNYSCGEAGCYYYGNVYNVSDTIALDDCESIVCEAVEIPPFIYVYDTYQAEFIWTNIDTCIGCTNPDACNYDPNATEDDGSCDYSCLCESDTVFIPVLDTIVVVEYVIDTLTITITEYIDCSTGMPCGAAMEELLDKSQTDGKIYNLLGQEINRREGIYIESGEVKYRLQ